MGTKKSLEKCGRFTNSLVIDSLGRVNLVGMQREHAAWAKLNFGDGPGDGTHSLLGVGEEVGELMHAQLKGVQGIRHTKEQILLKKVDAIGDIVIYLLDYCNREGLSMEVCIKHAWSIVEKRDWRRENGE